MAFQSMPLRAALLTGVMFVAACQVVEDKTSTADTTTDTADVVQESVISAPPPAPSPPPGPAPAPAQGLMRLQAESFAAAPEPPVIGRHPGYEVAAYQSPADAPYSTFSLEVDTAAYSVVRRYLRNGTLPPPEAVRIEEMLNYFDYDYPVPDSLEEGFRPSLSLFEAPWNPDWALLRVGVKAYAPAPADRKPLNLVLMVDRSGSMQGADRLGLIRKVVPDFLEGLDEEDTLSMIAYASGVEILSEPTNDHASVIAGLRSLTAGGATAGGPALEQAYALAQRAFDPEAENRILLITDGDFNVGISDPDALERFVAKRRDEGVGLSVLGVGQGNFNDALVQSMVQAGNGVAAYIDTPTEARRVLADGAAGLLYTVAADVKVQVEFNPAHVAQYRLIGYETRALETEDFLDETKDAGEVNAGRSVTALYEILPVANAARYLPEPRYSGNARPDPQDYDGVEAEWAQVKIAFKSDGNDGPQSVVRAVVDPGHLQSAAEIGPDDALAAAIAAFGGKLRQDENFDDVSYEVIEDLLAIARQRDADGWRSELLHLVSAAAGLDG